MMIPLLCIADGVPVETDAGVDRPAFFSTSGNQIVNPAGKPVKIAGVNWFGFETTQYAPHGLWARNYKEMMDQIRALGFNTIRLPFSHEVFAPGRVPNGISFRRNPDLKHLTSLEIMDNIIDYAGEIGLRIILDYHRLTAGSGAQESGLWFGDGMSEEDWIADWMMLAERYAGDPTVVGADLFNEPHHQATWGGGGDFDWARAATAAGNAIHAVNPDWLIVVEGIESYRGDEYWWGGHLGGVRDHPIELELDNKLVYSAHAYPNSIDRQPWFNDPSYPDHLPAKWTETWGYVYQEALTPLLLGEFGSRFEDPKDVQWMEKMFQYLAGDLDGDGDSDLAPGAEGISWTWWAWNANAGRFGGIIKSDWRRVHQFKIDHLAPLMFELGDGGAASPALEFEIYLSAASSEPVSVAYETSDDTARAGEDYEATSGTITMEPGDTAATVSVMVGPGGGGRFKLGLSNPVNAWMTDGAAIGAIQGGGPHAARDGEPTDHAAAPDGALVLDFTIRAEWGSGFLADMTVTNRSDQAVEGWRFLLDMPNDIADIWNGRVAEERGGVYMIESACWNRSLAPGASASVGFKGVGRIDPGMVDYTVIHKERPLE